MAASKQVTHPKRGKVYLVNFDPTLGAEIRKIRPAIIIQNDIANRYSPVTIVAAITSRSGEIAYPTEVHVQPPEGELKNSSVVLLNQVRTIDKRCLVKKLGLLSPESMRRVSSALKISLGIIEI